MADLLRDKVAVITGAGRGLGRAFAMAMAREGARVLVNDLGCDVEGLGHDPAPADEVVAEIRALGGTAVADYESIETSAGAERIMAAALRHFGRIDILVANAGTLTHGMVWEMGDESWERMVRININGTFYCARAACRVMKDQGWGRIIVNSSGAGLGVTHEVAYATVKEAQIGMARTIAKDMLAHGVTCNVLRPRAAATRLAHTPLIHAARRKTLNEAEYAAWERERAAQSPEKIAPLAVYLCTEHAAAITGCIFDMRENYIAIYDEPPRFARSVVKPAGPWEVDELIQVLPDTLLRELPPLAPTVLRRMMPDAKSWEWRDGALRETAPLLR